MQFQFTNEQLSKILDQSIVYQCACPAQVCKSLNELRALHAYQAACLNKTETDKAVHQRISIAAELCHVAMEQCLAEVLVLEGWDMQTLEMPEALQKTMLMSLA